MQKVAVVGVGGMGGVHCGAYARLPDAELVAVCDSDIEKAEEIAGKYSIQAFSSLEALLREVEVDVVDICTPTPMHVEYISAAAAAGKHVCVEKPLARTVGHAHEAVRVCEEAGVRLFVAHCLRWSPEFRKPPAVVVGGGVGSPVVVRPSQ